MTNKESIFVIGFPKSGNTWLARLLAEVTHSNIEASNVVDSADNSPNRKGMYSIHKKHIVKDVERVLQCRVVYIVRDVRDVLVSWFFHCNRWISHKRAIDSIMYRRYLNFEIKKSIIILRASLKDELVARVHYYLRFLLRGKSDRMVIGGWTEHVLFWTRQPNVVVVKYEDLLKDTEGELMRVVSKLGINVDCEQVQRAVFNQSFKKKKQDFQKKGDTKNFLFLNKGVAAGWKDFLYPSTVKKILSRHGEVMNKLGYIRQKRSIYLESNAEP